MTRQTLRVLILWTVVMDVANAMMASPKNLEVEQCIEWSNTSQGSTKRIRGFNSTSADEVCTETKIIVLKQRGNEMQHWLTDENGTYGRENDQHVALVSKHLANTDSLSFEQTLPSYKEITETIFTRTLISMES
jgi:hypothetical protein